MAHPSSDKMYGFYSPDEATMLLDTELDTNKPGGVTVLCLIDTVRQREAIQERLLAKRPNFKNRRSSQIEYNDGSRVLFCSRDVQVCGVRADAIVYDWDSPVDFQIVARACLGES